MPIYDMYPYTNLHELNLDWIIKVAKETQDTLTDITTMVSDLSDLSDCLHAYPNFSPNPRLQCDYDLAVSGDIRASGHSVICGGVVATGTVTAGTLDGPLSCGTVGSSAAPVYVNAGVPTACGSVLSADISGKAAKAQALCNSAGITYDEIGTSARPIYWHNGAPTQCDTTLGVSVTGSAASASKLSAAKTFQLTGPITGSVSTDLDSGMTIATTQNIIKKVSMQATAWSTQATTPLAGATITVTTAITNIDWSDLTFDPDNVVFLGAIVTSYEEQSLTFYPMGLYYQSEFQEMVMTVGIDGLFSINDMVDAVFDVYYINKLS